MNKKGEKVKVKVKAGKRVKLQCEAAVDRKQPRSPPQQDQDQARYGTGVAASRWSR